MSQTLHVVPLNDLVEHDCATDEATCVCGPRIERETYPAVPDGWLIIHNSLDGRERLEAATATELVPDTMFGRGCDACDRTGVVCSDDGTGPGYGNHPPGRHGDVLHPWDGMSNRADACDHGGGAPCPRCSSRFDAT